MYKFISLLLIFMMVSIFTLAYALDKTVLFEEDSISADIYCDKATSHLSRIVFYIGLIKESYNSICSIDKMKCENTSTTLNELKESLNEFEQNTLNFELDVIKKECVLSKDE